ncbi:MAG: hypothetical protein WC464_06935 [Bdellovibrionales bacterium]
MRRLLFSAIALLFVASPSFAASNVLLPDDSGNESESLPNLGLGGQPLKSTPQAQPETDLPNLGLGVQPSKPVDPAKTAQKPKEAPVAKNKDVPKPKKEETKPSSALPAAKILRYTDVNEAADDKSLPHNIKISLDEDSTLSAKDVSDIVRKIGLGEDKISSGCKLNLRGTLITDKSNYAIGNGTTQQDTVYYDGKIRNYLMRVQAMCLADERNIPPGKNTVVKIKDRFAVTLGTISCEPPSGYPSSLTITYGGGNSSECVYRK